MNGSPTHPACKRERGTTAGDLWVFRTDESVGILERTIANRPANEDRLRGLAWK